MVNFFPHSVKLTLNFSPYIYVFFFRFILHANLLFTKHKVQTGRKIFRKKNSKLFIEIVIRFILFFKTLYNVSGKKQFFLTKAKLLFFEKIMMMRRKIPENNLSTNNFRNLFFLVKIRSSIQTGQFFPHLRVCVNRSREIQYHSTSHIRHMLSKIELMLFFSSQTNK